MSEFACKPAATTHPEVRWDLVRVKRSAAGLLRNRFIASLTTSRAKRIVWVVLAK